MAIPQKRVMMLEGPLCGKGVHSRGNPSPTRIPRALQRRTSPSPAKPPVLPPTILSPTIPPPLSNLSWKFNPESRQHTLKPKLRPKTRPLQTERKGVGAQSDSVRCSVRIKNPKTLDKNNKAVRFPSPVPAPASPGEKGQPVEHVAEKEHVQVPEDHPATTCSLENLAERKDPFLLSTALIREAQRSSKSADTSEDANTSETTSSSEESPVHDDKVTGDINNNQVGYQAPDQNTQDGQYKKVQVREKASPTTDSQLYRANQVIIQEDWSNPELQQQMVAKEYQYHLQMINDSEQRNEPTSEYHREIRQLLRKLNVAQNDKVVTKEPLSSSTPDILEFNKSRGDRDRDRAQHKKTRLSTSSLGVLQGTASAGAGSRAATGTESGPVECCPPQQPPSDLSSLDGEDDGGGPRGRPHRLMSMDSGIQGSSYSCDQEDWPNEGTDAALREAMDTLDRSLSPASPPTFASLSTSPSPPPPAPPPPPAFASDVPGRPAADGGDADAGDCDILITSGGVLAGEAFNAVDELYVAGAVAGVVARGRKFTETHFDVDPEVSQSTPASLDTISPPQVSSSVAGGTASLTSSTLGRRAASADDVWHPPIRRHSLPAKHPRAAGNESGQALGGPLLAPHLAVVAVDLGTTYSGYAFSYTRDPMQRIHIMRKWEGGDPGLHHHKAPTALLLTPDGSFHSFGFLARDTFNDLEPSDARKWLYFDRFKMTLHQDTKLSRDTAVTAANGTQLRAITVFALALRHLRQRAIAELSGGCCGAFGGSGGVNWEASDSILWVLTVPALWGPPAKQLLREAAYQAGMATAEKPGNLLIALEPETASLCCRQLRLDQLVPRMADVDSGDRLLLDPTGEGTQYMVVDCGGGTVDITVHQLSGRRATLRELHKAKGGTCGSLGVDIEFERLLLSIFGSDFMEHFKKKLPAAYVELVLNFEVRKRSADPLRDTPISISLPFAFIECYRKFKGKEVEHAVRKYKRPHEVNWSSQGMLRLQPQLMAQLFKPTLDQIASHIRDVLASPRVGDGIEYMFLVGGFAESLLLQDRLRSEFGSKVKVVVPQEVSLATLRGAVLYGLDPSLVTSRRAKQTIGVGVLQRFQAGLHPQDKLVRLSDGSAWCADLLDVLVIADQPLGPGETVTRSYTPANRWQTSIIIHIYCCAAEGTLPKFITDEGVSRCGTLRLSLPPQGGAVGADDEGRLREILARIEFGGTELTASALDISSGRCVTIQLDFLSTAV